MDSVGITPSHGQAEISGAGGDDRDDSRKPPPIRSTPQSSPGDRLTGLQAKRKAPEAGASSTSSGTGAAAWSKKQAVPEITSTPQSSGLPDILRRPDSSAAQGQVPGGLGQGQVDVLNRVLEKKEDIQKIAAGYERLRDGAAIDSALPGSGLFLFQKNRDIEARFAAGEPALVRTLRYSSDAEAVAQSSDGGKTPAKREVDTLTNSVAGVDIVATPATLIGSGFTASIISRLEHPHRPKWKGLPSAVFLPAAADTAREQQTLQATGARRPGFGDIHSFHSSKAFGLNGYEDLAPALSHAERLAVLERNSRQFIKPDPMRPRHDFSHSTSELAEDLAARQRADPSEVLRHNEYFAKLELWDAKAVEIGDAKDVAIATLIEFNVEIASLERSLAREGANGPTLTEHLRRQLAWPADPSEAPLDLSDVESRLSQLGERESGAYLDGVLDQLRNRVTLCTYQYNETGSALRTLASADFSREDILAGIKRYLDARLPDRFNEQDG